ncbi:hypothetical protein M422DRAFT_255977 [Sphaerobolus stellatus SS14]|uniref:Uncharacterized protein n=1 Tax=Sphaerobolus stellatus (strain SS14) TaxID=990650 RepID=A0A0C9VI51_SPHS4|nr:hypothetical protein M422DRAFT_255977 [Sphaerobolus stellatus SS14]
MVTEVQSHGTDVFQESLSFFKLQGYTFDSVRSIGLQIIAKLVSYVKENPNLDHVTVDQAIEALEACGVACSNLGIPPATIFHATHDHTPIYWIIITAPSDDAIKEHLRYRILETILKAPFPNHETRVDAYAACLGDRSYHNFFQLLRKAPGVQSATVSVEHTLSWGCDSREMVEVEKGRKGWFYVRWTIPRFRARMRAVNSIGTEFVAQGRLWSISFSLVTNPELVKFPYGSTIFRMYAVHPSSFGGYFEGKLGVLKDRHTNVMFYNDINRTVIPVRLLTQLDQMNESGRDEVGDLLHRDISANWVVSNDLLPTLHGGCFVYLYGHVTSN